MPQMVSYMIYKQNRILVAIPVILLIFVGCTGVTIKNNTESRKENIESHAAVSEAPQSRESNEHFASSETSALQQVSVTEELPPSKGKIYLYGEAHGVESILIKELELWHDHYHNENIRHLFIEIPYFTAEFLNIWMQSDSDEILDAIYEDWAGTQSHVSTVKEFYSRIKNEFPETIFHGTDVGHQHETTGTRFLAYLVKNSLSNSEVYRLTQESIEQGRRNQRHIATISNFSAAEYRENMMVKNFIRAFDSLNGESVMGIYGAAHIVSEQFAYYNGDVDFLCMADQLKERYGDAIYLEDLSWMKPDVKPVRIDVIIINDKEYKASYYGKFDISWSADYKEREFWLLENAYEDLKDNAKTGNVLPFNNYPMLIEAGQVFVIDYTKKDDSIERHYMRSDGRIWNGMEITEQFVLD